jgi:acid phosphatase family membrane protein YuiD
LASFPFFALVVSFFTIMLLESESIRMQAVKEKINKMSKSLSKEFAAFAAR